MGTYAAALAPLPQYLASFPSVKEESHASARTYARRPAPGEHNSAVRLAAGAETVEPQAVDVTLSSAGELSGQVMSAQGISRAAVPVVLTRDGEEVARTATTENGAFTVTGLEGGLYTLEAEGGAVACRAWVAGMAPPVAQPAVLVVTGDPVERAKISGYTGAWLVGLGLAGIITAVSLATTTARARTLPRFHGAVSFGGRTIVPFFALLLQVHFDGHFAKAELIAQHPE